MLIFTGLVILAWWERWWGYVRREGLNPVYVYIGVQFVGVGDRESIYFKNVVAWIVTYWIGFVLESIVAQPLFTSFCKICTM